MEHQDAYQSSDRIGATGVARISERPQLVLAAAVIVAVGLNLWMTRGQTFFSDEWGRFTFDSSSLESLLRGYSGHLVVLHFLLYKALFDLFGADSYLPFRLVEAGLVGTCGLLFYAVARIRAEPWPSLFATLIVLFLGSAWEVVATPFGIVVLLPMALGLGALLCLERFPDVADPLACLLLIAAVASQSVGLAFIVGAAVLIGLQDGRVLASRMWIVVVPALIYVAWFAWYRLASGPTNEQVHIENFREIPSTIISSGAAGLSAMSGLFGTSGIEGVQLFNLTAGYLLLALGIVAVAWWVRSGTRLSPTIWVFVSLALAYWFLLGTVANPLRPPEASRYLYPSAVFLLLIGLELMRSVRPSRALVWLAAGVLVVSLVPNLLNLKVEATNIRNQTATERSQLGALELLRNEVPAEAIPNLNVNGFISLDPQGSILAASYFNAVDRYGSPADSSSEIAAAPEPQRLAVDQVLLKAGDLSASSLQSKTPPPRDCRAAPTTPSGLAKPIRIPSSGLVIRAQTSSSKLTVGARRFATAFQPVSLPAGSGPLVLKTGASQALRPWYIRIGGAITCASQ